MRFLTGVWYKVTDCCLAAWVEEAKRVQSASFSRCFRNDVQQTHDMTAPSCNNDDDGDAAAALIRFLFIWHRLRPVLGTGNLQNFGRAAPSPVPSCGSPQLSRSDQAVITCALVSYPSSVWNTKSLSLSHTHAHNLCWCCCHSICIGCHACSTFQTCPNAQAAKMRSYCTLESSSRTAGLLNDFCTMGNVRSTSSCAMDNS